MKLSTMLMYDGNPRSAADQVVDLEKAGLDIVWVAVFTNVYLIGAR